ncbi:MAG: replication-relaxation family protein [Myxococcales bacterium]
MNDRKSKKEGQEKGAMLMDRDEDLIALIAQVRYVTTGHAGRVAAPNRSLSAVRNRLRALSQMKNPYIKRLTYTDKRGNRIPVWGLTARGYLVASERLGRILKVPESDVGELFLNHDIQVAELAVRLWELGKDAKGSYTSPIQNWTWSSGSLLRLPFDVDESNKKNGKRLQPDAVVETPNLRVFVEYESGANGYDDPNKTGSIQNKLHRYWAFFNHKSSYAGLTWYRLAFPDDKPVRLLFVTATEALRRHIFWMVGKSSLCKCSRVATLDGAVELLREKVGPPARAEAPKVIIAPIKRESEKVTAADAELIRDFFNEALVTINQFQRAALEKRVPEDAPKFPKQSIAMRALLTKWEARLKAAPKASVQRPAVPVVIPRKDERAGLPAAPPHPMVANVAALPAAAARANPLDKPICSPVRANLPGRHPVLPQPIAAKIVALPIPAAPVNPLDRPINCVPKVNKPRRSQPMVAARPHPSAQAGAIDRPVDCPAQIKVPAKSQPIVAEVAAAPSVVAQVNPLDRPVSWPANAKPMLRAVRSPSSAATAK